MVDLMILSKDPCRFSRKQEVDVVLGGQAPPTSGPTTMGGQASLSYISHTLLLKAMKSGPLCKSPIPNRCCANPCTHFLDIPDKDTLTDIQAVTVYW